MVQEHWLRELVHSFSRGCLHSSVKGSMACLCFQVSID